MVKIRLFRMGAKSKPFYRIVAADSRSPRSGRYIEVLGTYDPKSNPAGVEIKADRISYWLERGAQPTRTVLALLKKAKFSRKQKASE